jgi:sugar/nucleoside kinase (ribokinase family)
MSAPRPIDVYALGNGIVDHLVSVTDVELEDLRLKKGGMALTDEDGQEAIQTFLGDRTGSLHAGGSNANTIVGLAQLGAKVSYACSLGDDDAGRFYALDFNRYGVHLTGKPKKGTTGTCVILITPDGERTMNTHLGISTELTLADVSEAEIARASWLYVEGYLLASPTAAATAFKAMETAKRLGTQVAITFSDGFIVESFGAHLRSAVKEFANLVFANQREAAAYTGLREPHEAIEVILKDCKRVCVTHGGEGSYVHLDGVTRHVPAFPATPEDLTGAGDLYAAGVLYGLTHGLNAVESAQLGSRLAHKVVLQVGARLPGTLEYEASTARI